MARKVGHDSAFREAARKYGLAPDYSKKKTSVSKASLGETVGEGMKDVYKTVKPVAKEAKEVTKSALKKLWDYLTTATTVGKSTLTKEQRDYIKKLEQDPKYSVKK